MLLSSLRQPPLWACDQEESTMVLDEIPIGCHLFESTWLRRRSVQQVATQSDATTQADGSHKHNTTILQACTTMQASGSQPTFVIDTFTVIYHYCHKYSKSYDCSRTSLPLAITGESYPNTDWTSWTEFQLWRQRYCLYHTEESWRFIVWGSQKSKFLLILVGAGGIIWGLSGADIHGATCPHLKCRFCVLCSVYLRDLVVLGILLGSHMFLSQDIG